MDGMTTMDLVQRLGVALVMGLILGIEREQHGRAAGMRTTMLVCVASAVVMLLSEHLFVASIQTGGTWRPDPARLAAGVLAGMGFLGAGVILRQDNNIHGVTTAAVLWFSAILGMAIGSGFFLLGLAGFLVVLIALFILPGVEARIRSDFYAGLSVVGSLNGPGPAEVKAACESLGLGAKLKLAGLQIDLVGKNRRIRFDVKIKKHRLGEAQSSMVEKIGKMKGVKQVEWT